MRKGENKNYRFGPFYPAWNRKCQKTSEKIKKIPLWHHFKLKQFGKGHERENKNYRFVPFLPDALQKISKKQQNNSKNKKKNTMMASFQAKIG